jgi:hypothetical protein
MKRLLLTLCLMSSAAFAQTSIYDYQGLVMTGTSDWMGEVLPDTETYIASLTFHGPLTNPNTDFDLQVTAAGTSGRSSELVPDCFIGSGCNVNVATVALNTKGNSLTSAAITIPDFNVDIGPKGDRIIVVGLDGTTLLSVSNNTPGTWTNATPGTTTKAPELDPASAGGGVTLLVGTLLMLRGRQPQRIAA